MDAGEHCVHLLLLHLGDTVILYDKGEYKIKEGEEGEEGEERGERGEREERREGRGEEEGKGARDILASDNEHADFA